MGTVDPKWVINRQGKDHVMYAGLLDLAHREGLVSIDTEIAQVGNDANGHVHIVIARVIMSNGRQFSGIGDASPANVSKMILPSALRMAETRAKARALRDAVNVGTASFEELPDDDERPLAKPSKALAKPVAKAEAQTQTLPEAKAELWQAVKEAYPGIAKDEIVQQVRTMAEHCGVSLETVEGCQAVTRFVSARKEG